MGLWTEAVLICKLKIDTPEQVIDMLAYLISPFGTEPAMNTPSHPFFQQPSWHMTLAMDCNYFPGETISALQRDSYDGSGPFHLTIRCKVKYGDLVTGLLRWLAPYIETQGFVGYRRNDENEGITLIYVVSDRVVYEEVTSTRRIEIG